MSENHSFQDPRIGDANLFRRDDPTIIEKMKHEFEERGINIQWFKQRVVNDDWAPAIHAAIKYANTKGIQHIFFPSTQVYRYSRISLDNIHNITLFSQEAELRQQAGTHRFEIKGNSSNIKIKGFIFNGEESGTISKNAHLITIRESENITIENCAFKNLLFGTSSLDGDMLDGNDGIYIRANSNDPGYHIKNVKIINCSFKDLSRQGVSIIQGEDIVIKDCHFAVRRSAVDIEPNHSYELSRNITIENCVADARVPTQRIYNTNIENHQPDLEPDGVLDMHYTVQAQLGVAFQATAPNLDVSGRTLEQIYFVNCKVYGNGDSRGAGFEFNRVSNSKMINNEVYQMHASNVEGVVMVKGATSNHCHNINIENMIIKGFDNKPAFLMYNCRSAKINHLQVSEGIGKGLEVRNPAKGEKALQNITIRNSSLINCGSTRNPMSDLRDITLIDVDYLLNDKRTVDKAVWTETFRTALKMIRCKFVCTGSSTLNRSIFPDTARYMYVILDSCEFRNTGNMVINGRVNANEYFFLKVHNCIFENTGFLEIGRDAQDVVITNNRFWNAGGNNWVVLAQHTSDLVFKDNVFKKTEGNTASCLNFSTSKPISNRIITGNMIIGDYVEKMVGMKDGDLVAHNLI